MNLQVIRRPWLVTTTGLFVMLTVWLVLDKLGANPLKDVIAFIFWREAAKMLDVIVGIFALIFWLVEKPLSPRT